MTDLNYLREALRHAKSASHDNHTHVGAVLVVGKRHIYAANRRAVGLDGQKADIIEHAERAAIYKAAACGYATAGGVLYAPWFACPDCARAIVLAGIREVVGLSSLRLATPERWLWPITVGDAILRSGGVGVRLVEGETGVVIRFNGEDYKC